MIRMTPELRRMAWTVAIALIYLIVVVIPVALSQELPNTPQLAPLELFKHPPAGTVDPYSPFPCACHGRDCHPVPTNWNTGQVQLEPDGPWVDLYRLEDVVERIFDVSELPGEYSKHVSICRLGDTFTCLFRLGAGV